jgi:RHS repeat-associated protein
MRISRLVGLLSSRVRAACAVLAACVSLIAGGAAPALAAGDGGPLGAVSAEGARSLPGPEVAQLRTRNSRTYRDADGGLVARVSAESVNYRDPDGVWQPIRNGLVATDAPGYAVRNRANRYALSLPDDVAGQPIRLAHGDAWVEFKLRGAAGTPVVRGATATYGDVLPGVDAAYTAGNDTAKEELIFRTAQTSRAVFTVSASAGLEPREREGAIEFVDGDGEVRFAFGRMFAYSADGVEAPAGAVDVSFERAGDGWTLTASLEEAWLAGAVASGPVVLDPQVWVQGPVRDCVLDSSYPSSTFCAKPQLGVGHASSTQTVNSALKFDVRGALPPGADVLWANLYLNHVWSDTANTQSIAVRRITRAWTNSATWNTKDGVANWTTAGGDYGTQNWATTPIGATTGWKSWAIDGLVRAWVDRTYPEDGLMLRSNTTTNDNYIVFASNEDPDPANAPAIDVGYMPATGIKPFWTFAGQAQITDRDSLAVNVGSGNLVMQGNDVSIQGTQMSNEIGRVYNSFPVSDSTAFGTGWRISNPTRLTDMGGYFHYRDGTGAEWRLESVGGGKYRAAGLKATLSAATVGHDLVFDANQTRVHFEGGLERWRKDRNDNKISTSYDSSGNVTNINDTQNRNVVITPTNGLITKVEDSGDAGPTTKRASIYGYSATGGRLASYKDPAGNDMTFGYKGSPGVNDDLVSIFDYRDHETQITYDAQHRVTEILRQPNSAKTTFDYTMDSNGPCDPAKHRGQTTVTDPNLHKTVYCYDDDLRVTKSKDANGHERDKAFDANSNVTNFQSGGSGGATLGLNASFQYTGDSALKQITQGSGDDQSSSSLTTTFDYTPANPTAPLDYEKYQPSKSTSAQGNSTLYGYDSKGNMTSSEVVKSGGGAKTELAYNTDGTVDWSKDPNGNQTDYTYDTSGNLKTIDPPGTAIGTTEVTVDGFSRIKTIKDGKGQIRTYTYDKRDRITNIAFAGGASTTYVYDANGNVDSRSDAPAGGLLGVTSYINDEKNRMTRETRPNGEITNYQYDKADNLDFIENPDGKTVYTHGPTNLLDSVRAPQMTVPTTFEYDDDGNRNKTTFPNGVVVTSKNDQAGRLQFIKAVNANNTVLQNLTYDYFKPSSSSEPTGCPTSPLLAGSDTSLLRKKTDVKAGDTTKYCYDELDRLDTAETTGSNPAKYEYTLDKAGNRTQSVEDDPGASPVTTTYGYNAVNQVSSVNGSPSATTFDLNGNQLRFEAGGQISYNSKDQTSGVAAPGGALSGFVHAGTDQNELVAHGGITLQNDALGVSTRTSAGVDTHFTRTSDGEPIAQLSGTTRYYFLKDERGSLVGLTNSSGALSFSYKYDPYGRPIGTASTTWGYAGGVRTRNGLTHFGARFYDPETGRWTQQDPLNQAADLNEANRYTYAGGDPVNSVDPSGEDLSDVVDDVGDGIREVSGEVHEAWRSTKSFVSSGPGRCLIGGALGAAGGAIIGGGVGAGLGARVGMVALGGSLGCGAGALRRVP